MKELLFCSFFFLFCAKIFAGAGGPDTWGYTWKDNNDLNGPLYNWIDITNNPTSTSVKLLGDDNSKGPFVMNFDFHYYWYDVNQFWVGSNGYILFEEGQLAHPFQNLPTTNEPNNIIGPFMNDLNFSGEGNPAQCWYWISSDHDTMIVSWVDVPFWTSTTPNYSGSNSFQIILSTIDSSITFQYLKQQGIYAYGGTRVGIENYSGTIGLAWNTVFPSYVNPPVNYAIKFYYPKNPTLAITDAQVNYNDNTSTAGIFLPQSDTPHTLITELKNSGTVTVNSFGVLAEVINSSGSDVVNTTQYTASLAQQQTQVISFASPFYPVDAGTFQFKVTSQLSGDNVFSNNSRTQEIDVIDTNQTEMRLGYDNGQITGLSGLIWIGGYGCTGIYIIPPIYPVTITKVHFWIKSNSNNVPFAARILDDDGAYGLPYTLLDSILVPAQDIVLNNWTDLELSNPIIINSGGFYVSWDMHGDNISLGMANHQPLAHRGYEAGHYDWGIFRLNETYDPMINATIKTYKYPIGIDEHDVSAMKLQLFPNPCENDNLNIIYSSTEQRANNDLIISDLQGRQVKKILLGIGSGTHQLSADVSELNAGIYFVSFSSGKNKIVKKLVVVD